MSYADLLARKKRVWTGEGVEASTLPAQLFPWQAAIVRWALKKGRAAIFADCGLGKTFMQVAWANALNTRTLILAPLCVAEQTSAEAARLGVQVGYARTMAEATGRIVITNYERLDKFDLSQFGAVVLDESSILKSFDGKTRTRLIQSCAGVKYRLCCTATPAPNDIAELANHAEFLGLATWAEFMATWFLHDEDGWRLKKHAVDPFFRWMASWAIALRAPSDIGYSDDGFVLPPLSIIEHVVDTDAVGFGGMLFPEMGAKGLSGRLSARRASLDDRVAAVAELVGADAEQWMVWCGLNPEADAIVKAVDGARQVAGSDDYDAKVATVGAFTSGDLRTLVSKLSILGYGMNFQHCRKMAFVGMGDSYEQYYQGIRRCYRFGQTRPVEAHVIVSEPERIVVENVRRKEAAAREMSDELVKHMADFEREEIAHV